MTTFGRHILLVEDNLADAKLAIKVFAKSSSVEKVHHVTDGDKALDFLNKRSNYQNAPTPDLIILDLNLPRKSGREILKEIKSHKNFQQIPVIILTSSDSDNDVETCLKSHANAYVTKALDLYQFVEILKSFERFWFESAKLPVKAY